MTRYALLTIILALISSTALAEECVPPPGGICLTAEQRRTMREALEELKDIHDSKAQAEFQTPIVIVREWDGRVYVNGGEDVPLKLKLRIGSYVDRDMEVTVKSLVSYRDEPPDPMFRLRLRAQAGVLLPQLLDPTSDGDDVGDAIDAGLGFDFFHVGVLNLSAHAGVRSVGAGPGVDITKNFGAYAGYALAYDGFRSGAIAGAYFSFN